MEERRKFVRLDTQLPLRYSLLPSGQSQPAVSTEVGGGGVRLVAPGHVQPETRLWVELQLPGRQQPVTFVGEVVWSEQHDIKGISPVEIGVRFVEISPEDRQAIMQHVDTTHRP